MFNFVVINFVFRHNNDNYAQARLSRRLPTKSALILASKITSAVCECEWTTVWTESKVQFHY